MFCTKDVRLHQTAPHKVADSHKLKDLGKMHINVEAATQTHHLRCWRGSYEVSPELLDRGLNAVAVGPTLGASYAFGTAV